MTILAFIELKKISREEFEAQYPKHFIGKIDGKDFMFWCNVCPDQIFLGDTFVFVDEDNKHLEHGTSNRRAHATHFFPELDK